METLEQAIQLVSTQGTPYEQWRNSAYAAGIRNFDALVPYARKDPRITFAIVYNEQGQPVHVVTRQGE